MLRFHSSRVPEAQPLLLEATRLFLQPRGRRLGSCVSTAVRAHLRGGAWSGTPSPAGAEPRRGHGALPGPRTSPAGSGACLALAMCPVLSSNITPALGGLCLQELEENSGWQCGLWLVQSLTPTGTHGLAAIEGVLQTHRLAHRSWRRLPRSTDESGVTSQKTGGRDESCSCLGGLTCNVGCHEAGHMGCRDGAGSRSCQDSVQPRQVLH